MLARSFEELEVYKSAMELQHRIFRITKRFPREERYALTDQVRRSSRSVGANIAEAWAKRRYPAHFITKLTDSDGEQLETRHWVVTARQCQYIDDDTSHELLNGYSILGKQLGSLMADAQSWSAKYKK